MTDTQITEEEFATAVRDYRGDYTPSMAPWAVQFVESIGRDREVLWRILSKQVPPIDNLAPGVVVPALDSLRALPQADRVIQLRPVGGQCRIGHVVRTTGGWTAFHYAAPFKPVIRDTAQLRAKIAVFVEHFATMGRPADA